MITKICEKIIGVRLPSETLRRAAFVLLFSLYPFYSAAQTRHTGEIEGAFFIVDVPSEPNGDVMFIARGFRPSFFPLSAIYEVDTDFYQALLGEGWTIASTSFRTNDWVVAEGAHDILALQAYVEKRIHPIERSFLYGETMGAGVAVWLAENRPETFAGVFALGAHLSPEPNSDADPSGALAEIFTGSPKLPILFAANTGETEGSLEYCEASKASDVPSIVWIVHRTGHVNLNSSERIAVMRALVHWAEEGTIEAKEDATIHMTPISIAAHTERYAAGNIRSMRPLYGNIYTNFVPSDLEGLNIKLGNIFEVTHGNSTYSVTYAKAYSDVAIGEWVAFIDPEGYLQISRNYANAAETLEARKNDPLLISTLP